MRYGGGARNDFGGWLANLRFVLPTVDPLVDVLLQADQDSWFALDVFGIFNSKT
jgi:hypothetical protein